MVITNVNQVVYQGDGVTTAFPFTLRIIDDTDIKLLLLDSDGSETDITSDFYVDTVNNTVHYPGYAPGAEPALSDRPPVLAEGQKLLIYRELPITQEKDLGDKWPFYVIELALDKLTMLIQDIYGWANQRFMQEKDNSWDARKFPIHNVGGPVNVDDAATKDYVDRILNGFVLEGDSRTVPFDNVAQMIAADLEVGQIAFTLGYHDINDHGAGVYSIRAKVPGDADDGGGTIFLDNDNVAELIVYDTVNVKQFGAKGDGVTDDTVAIRNAVQMQGTIHFNTDETYLITDVIRLKKDTVIDFCGCHITFTGETNTHLFFNFESTDTFTGYDGNGNLTIKNGHLDGAAFSFCHAENVLVENCAFTNCVNDHYFEICACKNYVITGCSFEGMYEYSRTDNEYVQIDCCYYTSFPWFSSDNITYDGTPNNGITIQNCTFKKGSKTNYTLLNACIGSHVHLAQGNHTNIKIQGCHFDGYSYRGIALWEVADGDITNCVFNNANGTETPYDILCYACSNTTIGKNEFANSKNTSVFLQECNSVSVVDSYQHDTKNRLVSLYNGNLNNVIGNVVRNASGGVAIDGSTNVTVVNNWCATTINDAAGFIVQLNNGGSIYKSDAYVAVITSDKTPTNNKITVSGLDADLTKVSKLKMIFGAISNATYTTVEVDSSFGSCFNVNEVFGFDLLNGNHCTVKIVSKTSLEVTVSTSITLRWAYVMYNS